ncbi:GNAT family N-acetyltransferase [Halobacillus rhizosphaerae]|uniref:GNAT family N-acetyltransferase n=1 Tax=Halobacillus rhizosphaerae TaxID=3064889 RepID=UPI00398A54C0
MDPQLNTRRLHLRPFSYTDAKKVSKLADDPVIAATTQIPYPFTLEKAEDWIALHRGWMEKGSAYPFALVTWEEAELVGTITIRIDKNHHKGELAYWIGKPYWGKGYATEAARRVIRFGFEELYLHRIWAQVIHSNAASQKVLEYTGMSYEGTLKEDLYHQGTYADVDIYGILSSTYVSHETK